MRGEKSTPRKEKDGNRKGGNDENIHQWSNNRDG